MRLQALRLELGGAPEHARAAARARWAPRVVSVDLDLDDGQRAIGDALARFCREQGAEAIARAAGAPLPAAVLAGARRARRLRRSRRREARAAPASWWRPSRRSAREAVRGPSSRRCSRRSCWPSPSAARCSRGEALVAVGTPPVAALGARGGALRRARGEAEAWRARPRGPIEALATLGGEPFGRVALAREAAPRRPRRAPSPTPISRARPGSSAPAGGCSGRRRSTRARASSSAARSASSRRSPTRSPTPGSRSLAAESLARAAACALAARATPDARAPRRRGAPLGRARRARRRARRPSDLRRARHHARGPALPPLAPRSASSRRCRREATAAEAAVRAGFGLEE